MSLAHKSCTFCPELMLFFGAGFLLCYGFVSVLLKKILLLVCSFSVIATVSSGRTAPVDAKTDNNTVTDVKTKIEAKTSAKSTSVDASVFKKDARCPLFGALESALVKNKEILSAQQELMSAHEGHVTATAAFRPKVSFNTKYQNENRQEKNSASSNRYEDRISSYGVGVNQNLFHGFSDVATLDEADLNIRARWCGYEAKKQEVLRNVSIMYFAILAKRDEINHLKALLESRQNSKEVADWMYKTGAVKYLDVSQAIAAVSETESKLAKAAADYISYRAQFEELTGCTLPQELSNPGQLFDEHITEKQALEIAKNNNPEIQGAVYSLSAAKAAVKKPNPEFVPSLDVSYSYNNSYNGSTRTKNNQDNNLREQGNTVALSLSVPIYDGGTARAEKRRYIDMATKAAVDKDKSIENVKTQIYSTWASMAAAKQSLLSAERAVEARTIALRDAEEEYKSGAKIISDVLEAQEKLFEAKAMHTQAQREYLESQCRMNALIGRMTPKYLKIADGSFDYKKHYKETRKKL